MTVTELVPQQSTVLVDARDTCLRATWHPTDHVVVLSHWREGVCASTFRLAGADITRMATFLVGVLGDQAATTEAAAVPGPAPANVLVRSRAWLERWRARLTNA
ncbi:MAG: hypothetical protein ABJC79_07635 [Acidimicrobiia bacterium]